MWWRSSRRAARLGLFAVIPIALILVGVMAAQHMLSAVQTARSEEEGKTVAATNEVASVGSDLTLVIQDDQPGARTVAPIEDSDDMLVLGAEHQAAAGPQPDDTGPAVPAPEDIAPPISAPLRVGIQAGHWRSAELPAELARLRTSTGTAGGGRSEWDLNLDIARRVAALLEAEGIQVDILPATVPPSYQADAFVALHADGDITRRLSGFKLARARLSAIPQSDDSLLTAIADEYGKATGLPEDSHISRNMTGYYAFNYRRLTHAIAPTTPAVILEMGFMTNASDLQTLFGAPDAVANGIARGIMRFLELTDAPIDP